MGKNRYEKLYQEAIGKRISRSKAIRLKCLDCSVYDLKEVRECPVTDCPLWRYRMGHEEHDEIYYADKNRNVD